MSEQPENTIAVYLELGRKRTFAGAIDWPGWSRSGRDETAALQALLDYAPRYAAVLRAARVEFSAPADVSAFVVGERLQGNSTTDFGAPGLPPSGDARPVDDAELRRLITLLAAYWQAFDNAVSAARGKELKKGPRRGGRDLDHVVRHVEESGAGYLAQTGWKPAEGQQVAAMQEPGSLRRAIRAAVAAGARGELPERGPRGGVHWTPRYLVRRLGWHVLDHAWEIEDRIS